MTARTRPISCVAAENSHARRDGAADPAGGLVCLALEDERLRQLDLPPMVRPMTACTAPPSRSRSTPGTGVGTGISAADRLATVRAAIAPNAKPADLARPGHIFPLRAVAGGVLARRGHTEGSVDLAKLAGLMPAAVIVELMDREGEMLRSKAAKNFARRHRLPGAHHRGNRRLSVGIGAQSGLNRRTSLTLPFPLPPGQSRRFFLQSGESDEGECHPHP